MPNRCSPDAPMNAYDVRALSYLWWHLPQYIEEDYGQLLVRIGLAKVNTRGTLEITEEGMRRFMVERYRPAPSTTFEDRTA
ncbi:hypothetical protein RSO01_86920 [Reyranella soli]|uniref:Uncharacterized protein n=1 Tax=Reyranella soli TaxID=1230389 RepID=A0A512NRE2_9HYPH|nr:hypothetical protein RSO01_86920 [Reyranella soli]